MRNPLILIALSSFFVILLSLTVVASFQEYTGTTQWNIKVTQDEISCGGAITTKPTEMTFTHSGNTISVLDPEHGKAIGTILGDSLTIQKRTIRDGAGNSDISAYTIRFSPDCDTLSTAYSWNYKDSQGSCSGTTEWRGTRTDGKGCPAPPQQKQTTQKSQLQVGQPKQASSQQDPKDFWQNWDLAEQYKNKGDYKGYFTYLNRATANEQIFAETRKQLHAHAREELGISSDITSESVPLLRSLHDEIKNGGIVYNMNFPKPKPEHQNRWKVMLWASLVPDSSRLVHELVGVPEVSGE